MTTLFTTDDDDDYYYWGEEEEEGPSLIVGAVAMVITNSNMKCIEMQNPSFIQF